MSQFSLRRKAKKLGVTISKSATVFESNVYGGFNNIHDNTIFKGSIGYGSYVCLNCEIYGSIGKFSSIANNVKSVIGTHPTNTYVSTHPCFYSIDPLNAFTYVKEQKFEERKFVQGEDYIIIGNDVWIGDDVRIMQGVTIGDGAIVGTGSIVTKDVPPYAIVAGVPARILKYRFNEEQIKFLLNFKWWDKPLSWIEENHDLFLNIDEFIKNNK